MLMLHEMSLKTGLTHFQLIKAMQETGLKGTMHNGTRLWTEKEMRLLVANVRGLKVKGK